MTANLRTLTKEKRELPMTDTCIAVGRNCSHLAARMKVFGLTTKCFAASGFSVSIREFLGMAALLLLIMQVSVPNALAQNPVCTTGALTNKIGDSITVTATVSTGDLGDPGEGEAPLTVTSSGGELSNATVNYTCTTTCTGGPTNFTYTATQAHETITGTIPGADGDESCTLSASVTPATVTAPPVLLTSGQTNDADFSFSAISGEIVDHKLHFPAATPFPSGNVNVLSSNVLLSDSGDWPPYVIGTPFAPSHLFVKNGDNQAISGTDIGSMYDDKCYVSDPSTATEGQCPGFDPTDLNPADVITAKDKFDPKTKPDITPGPTSPACATHSCTAALIHFYPTHTPTPEAWSPSGSSPNPVCTDSLNGSTSSPPPPPDCDLANVINFQLSGDQTTTSGGTKRKGAYVSVFNVPMLETQVFVNGVQVNTPGRQQSTPVNVPFQSSTGSVKFTVNPAGCLNAPSPPTCPAIAAAVNNFLSPAPVALLNYTVTSGATTVTSGTPTFPTSSVVRQPVQDNTILQPGTYVIQFQALDSVGNVEQNIHKVQPSGGQCPDGSPAPSGSQCYVTSPFTATVVVTANLTFTSGTKVETSGTPPSTFQINGGFTLSGGSGIPLSNQSATLTVGGYTVTVLLTYSKSKSTNVWSFKGTVAGVNLQTFKITGSFPNYTLQVQASGAVGAVGNGSPLTLTISGYTGTK